MREHTVEHVIWDEEQLGAVAEVLGNVDQLIIDRSIMDEIWLQHFMTARKHMIKSTMTRCSEYISRLEYQGI